MTSETPAQVAAVFGELTAWLATHPNLPTFCIGGLARNTWDGSWDLTVRITAPDDGRLLYDLARWADALGGTLSLSGPCGSTGYTYQQVTATGQISNTLRVEAWGRLALTPKDADP